MVLPSRSGLTRQVSSTMHGPRAPLLSFEHAVVYAAFAALPSSSPARTSTVVSMRDDASAVLRPLASDHIAASASSFGWLENVRIGAISAQQRGYQVGRTLPLFWNTASK